MNYTQHELSAAFPSMSDEEFDELVADIAQNGQREPIVVFEDGVLDGWHRYSACLKLGIAPKSKQFSGDEDPVAFVKSVNLHRRHMTASQRAMSVAACASWLPRWRPAKPATVAGFAVESPKTMADLAQEAGVGLRTMERAAKVAKDAAPEVAKAVVDGRLPVGQAADIAALPKDEQPAAVAAPAKPAKKAKPPAADEAAATIAAQAGQIEELATAVRELLDENTVMTKVFDADDKLAAAMAENKQLRAEVAALRERVNGLMNEKNAAVRAASGWKHKAEASEKAAA